MLDPNIILRGQQVENPFESAAQGIQFGQGLRQLLSGRQAGKMQQITSPEDRQAFANKSMFSRELNAQIKADNAAKLAAQMAQEKHYADIGKTKSEAGKIGAETGKITTETGIALQDNASSIWSAFLNGGPDAAKAQLENLKNRNLIDPVVYQSELNALTNLPVGAAEQQKYAFGRYKGVQDPKYTLTTEDNVLDNQTSADNNVRDNTTSAENNIRTNQTSENNNVRTTSASMYSTDKVADTAQKKLSFDQARLEFEQKKGIVQQFGDNMYMVYPDGSAVPISSPAGQPVTKANPTTKNSIAEEQQRTQKVSVTLDAIEGLLDDATGSGIGRLVDGGARLFGVATKGDVATAQLGTLGGQLVALMPKMSGPQSDKDVEMYKQMAGKLDDPSIPIEIRRAALGTIRELNDKYGEMNEARGQSIPYANAKPSGSRPPVTSFFQ